MCVKKVKGELNNHILIDSGWEVMALGFPRPSAILLVMYTKQSLIMSGPVWHRRTMFTMPDGVLAL